MDQRQFPGASGIIMALAVVPGSTLSSPPALAYRRARLLVYQPSRLDFPTEHHRVVFMG